MVNICPFGTLLDGRTVSTDSYRYGFQGQEGDDEVKGEGNSVNYKYRMHDPRVGRFFAVDPLSPKYPWNSSYAFSENKVIAMVELEGLEATDSESASMSADVYNTTDGVRNEGEKSQTTGGWELNNTLDVTDVTFTDNESGFNSALYQRKRDNGTYEYTYVTQGTDMESLEDWINNAEQAFGYNSEQYEISIKNAQTLKRKIGHAKYFRFTGHSLGGGLAAANSKATGIPATTFNAAGLSKETKENPELNCFSRITAYVVEGEIVSVLQGAIGLRADGAQATLNTTYSEDAIERAKQRVENHSMSVVLKLMKVR